METLEKGENWKHRRKKKNENTQETWIMKHWKRWKRKTSEKSDKPKSPRMAKIVSIIRLKYFYYEFDKNFRERCFLNGCSLFYILNYIKFWRIAAFECSNYQLLILSKLPWRIFFSLFTKLSYNYYINIVKKHRLLKRSMT